MKSFLSGFILASLLSGGFALATHHDEGIYGETYRDYNRFRDHQRSEEQWRKDLTEENRFKQPC